MVGSGAWACAAMHVMAGNINGGDPAEMFEHEVKMWVRESEYEVSRGALFSNDATTAWNVRFEPIIIFDSIFIANFSSSPLFSCSLFLMGRKLKPKPRGHITVGDRVLSQIFLLLCLPAG